jgi:cation transport regulator ChaB
MPFDIKNPPEKIKKLSEKKQRQWIHVFNSCWDKNKDDALCHKMAWGAVKKSSVENPIANELVKIARLISARGFSFQVSDDWDKLLKWLQSKFKHQKFTSREQQTGDAIFDRYMYAGKDIIAHIEARGWEPEDTRYNFGVWIGYDEERVKPPRGKEIKFSEMKKAMVTALKKNPDVAVQWSKKGLTEKQQERLKQAVDKVADVVQSAVKGGLGTLERQQQGSYDSSVKITYSPREQYDFWHVLEIKINPNRNQYEIYIFDRRVVDDKKLGDFVKSLRGIKRLLKEALSRMDPSDVAMILGKIKPETVVKSVGRIKVEFDIIDEWLYTEVIVPVTLTTSKKVPKEIMEKWLMLNWDRIKSKAPSKTPRIPEGRGMEYDEPSGEVGFIPANRMSTSYIENVYWEQDGRKGVVRFSGSQR